MPGTQTSFASSLFSSCGTAAEERVPPAFSSCSLQREPEAVAGEEMQKRRLQKAFKSKKLAGTSWLPGGSRVSSRSRFALSTFSPWLRLKGLLSAVLALTMLSTELAEKRIWVAFASLVLPECGFQRYCCVAPAVSSSRVWRAPAALPQHNLSRGSSARCLPSANGTRPASPKSW